MLKYVFNISYIFTKVPQFYYMLIKKQWDQVKKREYLIKVFVIELNCYLFSSFLVEIQVERQKHSHR